MPVLFRSTASALGPSLYASTASRYIFRAMKMSPRVSGVISLAGVCAASAAEMKANNNDKESMEASLLGRRESRKSGSLEARKSGSHEKDQHALLTTRVTDSYLKHIPGSFELWKPGRKPGTLFPTS